MGVGGILWEDAAQKAGYCKNDTCTPAEVAKFAEDRVSLEGDIGLGGEQSWEDAAMKAGYCKKAKCTPAEVARYAEDNVSLEGINVPKGGLGGDIGEISWDDAAKAAGYCKKAICTPAEIAKFAKEKVSIPGEIGADGKSWEDAAKEAGYCKNVKCTLPEIAKFAQDKISSLNGDVIPGGLGGLDGDIDLPEDIILDGANWPIAAKAAGYC